MSPAKLAATGFATRAGGVIVAPPAVTGTIRRPGGEVAVIDMGVFTGVTRDWCSEATTDLAWRAAPHWPVLFHLTAAKTLMPVLLVTKPLATTLVHGPFKEEPDE